MNTKELQPVGNNGSLTAQDFTQFDDFLENLGLPQENILASIDERTTIQNNFPSLVNSISEGSKNQARYLSKFAAASYIGLFDAALNYVWNEVVLNLRQKAILYGIDLFFDSAVGGKNRDLYVDEDDLSGLKDIVLLDTCQKLELISETIYKKLSHILIMRNDIGASHPNDSSINAFELLGWLQTCVFDVINDKPSLAALQVKAFIENLRNQTDVIDNQTIKHMEKAIKALPTKNNDNLLRTLFGIYAGSTDNIIKKNISVLAPFVWENSNDSTKLKLGEMLDGYRTNLYSDKLALGNEFFDFCDGNRFKTIDARVIELDDYLDELYSAHQGWDNFHHEVQPARKILKYIKTEADIPPSKIEKLIKVVMKCRIGNGVSYQGGVSSLGKPIYNEILNKLGDENIVKGIITFYNSNIYNILDVQTCLGHAINILEIFEKNAVNEKLIEIIQYLLKNSKYLSKTLKSTPFKKLASSHIKFK